MGILSKFKKQNKKNNEFVINPNINPELKKSFYGMIDTLTSITIGEFIKAFYIDIPGVIEPAENGMYRIDEVFEESIFKDIHDILEKKTNNYKKDYSPYLWPAISIVLIEKFNLNTKDIAIVEKVKNTVQTTMNIVMTELKDTDIEGEINGAK